MAYRRTVRPLTCDTSDGAPINLLLYTDHAYSMPISSNPNVTLGLNVCTVITGLESFILPPVPCTSGDVAVWAFTNLGCRDISDGFYHGAHSNNDCYAALEGAIAALMRTCNGDTYETEPSAPTSSTNVAVDPVATGG